MTGSGPPRRPAGCGMCQYTGWVVLCDSTYEPESDRLAEAVRRVREFIDGITWVNGFIDLRYMNGEPFVTVAGNTNRPGSAADDLHRLWELICRVGPGPYGLVYEWDDETQEWPGPRAFKVHGDPERPDHRARRPVPFSHGPADRGPLTGTGRFTSEPSGRASPASAQAGLARRPAFGNVPSEPGGLPLHLFQHVAQDAEATARYRDLPGRGIVPAATSPFRPAETAC